MIEFDNQDAGMPHNVEIKDAAGAEVFKGDDLPRRRRSREYQVRRSPPATYPFVCTVHPNMTGTLTAE